MHRLWQWILIGALSATGTGVFAVEQKQLVLSLEDPYSLKWGVLDNPAGMRIWARQQYSTIDPDKDSARWVLAVASYIRVREVVDNNAEMRKLLNKALELAKHTKISNDALFTLRAAEMDFQLAEEYGIGAVLPPGLRNQQFQEKMRIADELRVPGRKGLTAFDWGQFMIESGRESDGIKKMMEAMRELNANPTVDDVELIQAKEIYAASLTSVGSKGKSKLIYDELEAICAQRKFRYFCLLTDHDYAYLLMSKRTAESEGEALKAMQRALAGAEELGDQAFVGMVSNSLLMLLNSMGRYEEARTHALRAMEIYKQQNDGVWLADTQKKLAKVLINLHKPEEALQLLTVASQSFPKDYYYDQTEIALDKSRVYKELGRPQQAFDQLSVYARALKDSASRNQNTEIAQFLTQINLELEEEQSRSLTEAENLQKEQDKLAEVNRLEQQSTLLLINGIWVVSGFLILSGVLGLIWIRKQNQRIIRLNRHLREDILQRFLPAVIADRVAKGQAVLDEIPSEQTVTALFGRLVGLEHAIEDLGPRVTARLLESLMQAVTDVSMEHNGCLDKLHRGSFLILFGAPIQRPAEEQIQHAIEFAQAIQNRFNQIRDSWPIVEGWRPGLAIGIHHGPALVGVFGGKRRADYTAIGQTVNVAARIEGEAKSGDIMVSEKVAEVLPNEACRDLGEVRLKGISKPQRIYVVDSTKIKRAEVPPAA